MSKWTEARRPMQHYPAQRIGQERHPLTKPDVLSDDEESFAMSQASVEDFRDSSTVLWGWFPIGCLPDRIREVMQKQLTSTNGLVLLLILTVIAAGTVNRVLQKIQVTDRTMKPYAIFITDVAAVGYVLMYFSIFAVRYCMGIITRDMVIGPKFPYIDYRFIIMGLMDATRQVISIYCAGELSGFLITLLGQGVLPMTMIVAFILLKTRYSWGQLAGAGVLIVGVVVSIVPELIHEGGGGSIIWAVVFFVSGFPAAISLALKEMVFTQRKDLDVFVVNSMDSLFQCIFTFLFLPLIAIPGFGGVEFSDFPDYINKGAHCLVGISLDEKASSCDGMPYATIIYIAVNLVWNISFILLVKQGGAVLSFIAAAVSFPLANLAFILDWPLLPGNGFTIPDGPLDLLALVVVLSGLIIYRVFSIMLQRKKERAKLAQDILTAMKNPTSDSIDPIIIETSIGDSSKQKTIN